MVRSTPHYTEWYPYLVNKLIGNNLSVGDPIFEVVSNYTEAVSALAWKQGNQYKLLFICKVDQEVIIKITGLAAGEARIYRIDNSSMGTQSKVTEARQVTINGYTVLLISYP